MELGWQLGLALVLLVGLGTGVALWGRLPTAKSIPWVALRSGAQLLAVSLIVGVALSEVWLALIFVSVMFTIGVFTTSRRTGLRSWRSRGAAGLAMLAGALPVLAIIFLTGTAPLNGPALVPIASIIIGAMMTTQTLVGRRGFAELRGNLPEYEAYLSLGLERTYAVHAIVSHSLHEAVIPALDQTRTAGLVTLPGAYVGVLLGGGSPLQAAAAQVLVLVGINCGHACTAVTARWLMARGWLLPPDLRERLRP